MRSGRPASIRSGFSCPVPSANNSRMRARHSRPLGNSGLAIQLLKQNTRHALCPCVPRCTGHNGFVALPVTRARLMTYHLECQVCRQQVEVADASAKMDQCPECGSFFTMMPVTVRTRATVANLLRYSDPDLLAAPTPAAPSAAPPTSPSPPAPLPQSREKGEVVASIPKG